MGERDDQDLAIEQLAPTHTGDRSDATHEARRSQPLRITSFGSGREAIGSHETMEHTLHWVPGQVWNSPGGRHRRSDRESTKVLVKVGQEVEVTLEMSIE
jgi:hypothetical protein